MFGPSYRHRPKRKALIAPEIRPYVAVAAGGAVALAVGLLIGSFALAALGLFVGFGAYLEFRWQRDCLKNVTYRRELGQHRATFGEEVRLSTEIANDKLLPLPWLSVEDGVPRELSVRGADVVPDAEEVPHLVQHQPILSRQHIAREFVVVCDHRGVFRFGPSQLSSGDPLGVRQHHSFVHNEEELLVYPKLFELSPVGVASRIVIGDDRSRFELIEDPSRIAGVREYRSGDPLRKIDWRASARSTALLVREFDPTVTLRVAVFLDMRLPHSGSGAEDRSPLEFTVAVAASLISDFARRSIATGLFSSATVRGQPIAIPPSISPLAEPTMLEALARASEIELLPIEGVLSGALERLRSGVSAVVVATDFRPATLEAISTLRRRHAVTAVWVRGGSGAPPLRDFVDASFSVEYSDDWKRQQVLELVT